MYKVVLGTLLAIVAAQPALAFGPHHAGEDRVSLGTDITVGPDETGDDMVCLFCSVHLHGDVKGDVAVLFGSVDIDGDNAVSGDVAVLGGDVLVADRAAIHGDLALAGGQLRIAPDGIVNGDETVLGSRAWLLAPLAPLLILIGIIWLIVWLVRRNRYPYLPPVRRY